MTTPTVGSLFSGIGGFDLGLERAGWRVIWQVEANPFRRRILKRHWPDVELRGDIATDTNGLARPDLICGGFPCQDVSVAGNRAGLDGERSGLWYEYLRVVRELRPAWVLIENVPGLLSSHEGKDFEIVVSGLAECGYGVAWRLLDSQNWGVPQRRRRMFIVGHLGAPCPIEVLFESEGGVGDSEAGAEAGKDIANSLRASTGDRGTDDPDRYPAYIPERVRGGNDRHDESGNSLAFAVKSDQTGSNGWGVSADGNAYTLDGANGQAIVTPSLRASDPNAARGPSGKRRDGGPGSGSGDKVPIVAERVSGTVTRDSQSGRTNGGSEPIPANLIAQPLRANRWGGSDSHGDEGNVVAQTLLGSGGHDGSPDPDRHSLVYGPTNYAGGRDWHELQRARAVNPSNATNGGSSGIVVSPPPDADGVRKATGLSGRLDPAAPDGPRYAALGDAVTVPVIEWIGRRLLAASKD